jgi:hypothetical protein
MKVTKVTPSELVEVYSVDLPAIASDAEVIAATETLAPLESTRQEAGEPFISWREHGSLDAVAAELVLARAAFDRATEQAKSAIEGASEEDLGGQGERVLADKFGVDRTTIRRWRGK